MAMNKVVIFVVFLLVSSLSWGKEPIKIGMSTALNGPAAALGNNMRVGVESYFSLVNQKGGIDGRLLELIVRDDGYEPEHAAFNIRQLIDQAEKLAFSKEHNCRQVQGYYFSKPLEFSAFSDFIQQDVKYA